MSILRRLLITSLAAAPALSGQGARTACAPDNAGLTVPQGFCVQIVADSVGPARHVTVAPNGDIFIALSNSRTARGGVLALRDADGDGIAETTKRFGIGGGSEVRYHDGFLYFGTDSAIIRWRLPQGALEPTTPPDTIVSGLLSERGHHAAKTFAIGADGWVYVNIGVPSNACEEGRNQQQSKGQDPCPLLANSGGVWRFDTRKLRQKQSDGERWATGLRNLMAIAMDPSGRSLWAVQHGRDLLNGNWGKVHAIYTVEKSAENPAEEMFRIEQGGVYGWPYCYYDIDQKKKVLAPEYGGDGTKQDRCTTVSPTAAAYPGHWAPNGLTFYSGAAFPAQYRNGAFIAFHGSWNRAPAPQAGFNVVFQPFTNGAPSGNYTVFADGFRGAPNEMRYRPTGLAQARDGSLIVTDDKAGRVYRVRYVGR